MFVKEVSGKELRDFHGKGRVADRIRNSPQEAPSNNSPATPVINIVKRPRLEVSSSPPVQIPRSSQPSSSEGVNVSISPPVQIPRSSKLSSFEGVNEMWISVFNDIVSSNDGDATSVWDNHFPFGDLIDKHFIKEKFAEKFKDMDFKRVLQTSLVDSIKMTLLHRVIGQKFDKIVMEKEAYVGQVTELKKKLSEYEKKMAEMTTLEDELNKLKKTSRDDILKIQIKEDAHKKVVDKLNAEIKKLKDDAPLIYKTGYDNAVDEVVRLASGLKPKPSN
ncbi:hypothetical protein MtrunA17_Chr1g0175761 [Medicago truncatula]|uniref:Uncharacterized protein n=1 Tax=Medicago truncatula TaxID=3880 RepID=A0A072VJW7_MEDTR|nr:uncharacterized protein LOC25483553 [Medicago truncatula]KEH41738.1 hypothetical protein MTR_1g054365 [Medicago truncatula]RHN79295.1 hypothetical protein MtrunA17_Chr1g0175761 [Medicago truncatula]